MLKKKMTLEDLRGALARALQAEGLSYPYIADVWPFSGQFVYGGDRGTYMRSYEVSEEGDVTLGNDAIEVDSRIVWEPVAMAVFSAGADYVEWEGEIFRAGHYPDKGVTVTPDHLAQMVSNHVAAPLMIEHMETPLDEAFKGYGLIDPPEQRGDRLRAKVRIPMWLHEGMKSLQRKVSVRLSADLSRITEISLVRNPRVVTAQLFAADVARVLIGAVPTFSTDPQIRDLAAKADNNLPPARDRQEPPMTPKERLLALFRGLTPEQRQGLTEEDLTTAFAATPANPDPVITDPAAKARIDALEAHINAQARQGRAEAALRFYADQLQAARVVPAQKDAMVALFATIAEADATGGVAFGEDGPGVKALKAFFAASPAHFHGHPVIPVTTQQGNQTNPFALTPEQARAAHGIQERK